MMPGEVASHRVLYDRGHRFLVAEGHPDPDGLCAVRPERLVAVQEAIVAELKDLGVAVPTAPGRFARAGSPGFAGIRRLDLAVDAERSRPVGRAILNGVAAVEAPGQLRSNVFRARSGRNIETVTWQGTAGKVARVYDKGVESGTHHAGERVRLEDQRRFPIGTRPLLEEMTAAHAAMLYRRRFAPLRAATKGIIVTSEAGLADRIKDAVECGDLTPAEAAKLSGLAFLQQHGVEVGSRTTRWRHRRQLQQFGVVLGDGVLEDVEIDLGFEVDQVVEQTWESDRDREAREARAEARCAP
jgi:hypothetical protein